MRITSYIIVNIVFLHLSFGQSRLMGKVFYHNSGERPVAGIEVNALGANSVLTKSNGLFTLTFTNKKPGERVRLTIGNTDGKGQRVVVVNDKQLEVLRLPLSSDETLVEVFVTSPDQRTAAVKRFYGILEKVTLSEYERKIDEIKKELQQSNLSSKKTTALIAQTDKLRKERDEALKKIEKQATYIASINKDRASELVKAAIKKIEKGEDINGNLTLLDHVKLEKVYRTAVDKEAKGKIVIKQVIEGYKLKIDLLLRKNRYNEAIICYEEVIDLYENNQFDKEELAYWYEQASVAYNNTGNLKKTITHQQKAITIQEEVINSKHSDLARSYHNMAKTYMKMDKLSDALTYQEKAIAILKSFPNHPEIKEALNIRTKIIKAIKNKN